MIDGNLSYNIDCNEVPDLPKLQSLILSHPIFTPQITLTQVGSQVYSKNLGFWRRPVIQPVLFEG
jgi:hypothetical protein